MSIDFVKCHNISHFTSHIVMNYLVIAHNIVLQNFFGKAYDQFVEEANMNAHDFR